MLPHTDIILTKAQRRDLNIANCRCCLLGLKDCKACSFSFALKVIEAERIEIVVSNNLLIPIPIIENFNYFVSL